MLQEKRSICLDPDIRVWNLWERQEPCQRNNESAVQDLGLFNVKLKILRSSQERNNCWWENYKLLTLPALQTGCLYLSESQQIHQRVICFTWVLEYLNLGSMIIHAPDNFKRIGRVGKVIPQLSTKLMCAPLNIPTQLPLYNNQHSFSLPTSDLPRLEREGRGPAVSQSSE